MKRIAFGGDGVQRAARIVFMLIIAAMLFLFFTNDFGLVDIHKTSVVVALGIDAEDGGYSVTAQAAVPTPAQGEGSAAYTQVTGEGATVAEAIDRINAKTGFYPKLTFCNLIVLGESCEQSNIYRVLDFFYRNEYVPLTALVGMCRGSARGLLGQKPADGGMSSSAISRAMSEELRNSANAATVNLKMFAQDGGSASAASYMPFIEFSDDGSGGTTSASSDGSSGGSGKSSGGEGTAEFTCLTTAAFSDGEFKGVLDEDASFALNLIKNSIRLAVVNTVYEGENYTVGLKNNYGSAALRISGGVPVLRIKFSGLAHIQSAESNPSSEGAANSHLVPDGVLEAVSGTIKGRLQSLTDFCTQNSCDLVGAGRMLYEYGGKYYGQYKDNLFDAMKVEYDVKIKSVR